MYGFLLASLLSSIWIYSLHGAGAQLNPHSNDYIKTPTLLFLFSRFTTENKRNAHQTTLSCTTRTDSDDREYPQPDDHDHTYDSQPRATNPATTTRPKTTLRHQQTSSMAQNSQPTNQTSRKSPSPLQTLTPTPDTNILNPRSSSTSPSKTSSSPCTSPKPGSSSPATPPESANVSTGGT